MEHILAEPITTGTVALAGASIAGANALKLIVKDIYESGKSAGIDVIRKWKYAKSLDGMYNKALEVRMVKTLWQLDKSVDLNSFYYPARLETDTANSVEINSVAQLPQRAILKGTVGQGKSILMRYLAGRELYQGNRLPLFLELRKVNDGSPLKSHLGEHLHWLGFPSESIALDLALKSGRICLILDGYDEINEKQKEKTYNSIDKLSAEYPQVQIVISSRPDTEIFTNNQFEVSKLARLDEDEVPSVVTRLMSEKGDPEGLITALNESNQQVIDLLDTPLMVTLLLIAYSRTSRIPETFSEFFENLFVTLLSRHDEAKPGGYRRERKSMLSDSRMQKVFDALAFMTKNSGSVELKRSKIIKFTEKALAQPECDCSPDDFLKDIHSITCLLLKEGDYFRYIHKSVQEYHAALYIESRKDQTASEIYSKLLPPKQWLKWLETLEFLAEIDRYRFLKYFYIPDLERFFEIIFGRIPKRSAVVSKVAARKLLYCPKENFHTLFGTGKIRVGFCGPHVMRQSYCSRDNSWVFELIHSLPHDRLKAFEREDCFHELNMEKLIDDDQIWDLIKTKLQKFVDYRIKQLVLSRRFIEQTDMADNDISL